jgi:ankyrin repeat protein
MELGGQINDTNDEGLTPLYLAAQHNNVPIVRYMVTELGADVNQTMRGDGGTALLTAADWGRVALVRCLGKELGADVNQSRNDGCTPVSIACQQTEVAVVRCLVTELGADVNRSDDQGHTPLYNAARDGKYDLVRCLVKELGADVNQAKENGCTPIMAASFFQYEKVLTCSCHWVWRPKPYCIVLVTAHAATALRVHTVVRWSSSSVRTAQTFRLRVNLERLLTSPKWAVPR